LGIQNANIDGFRLREGMSRVYERINVETQKIFNAEGKGRNINDLIKLNCPVTEIRNGNVPVQVVTKAGVTYTCEKVIMSLPVATFHRIKFESLSTSKRLLVENQLECNMTRMALVFKEPFWRKQNYSGSVLFSHNFPMNELVDLTPDSQAYGVLAFAFTADGFKRWNQ
jgi:monoamine oxidase